MLPWHVLHWDAGHCIFLGAFYYAISILGLGVTFVVLKSIKDYFFGGGEHH